MCRKRRSVIVKHCPPKIPFKIEKEDEEVFEENMKTYKDIKEEEIEGNIILQRNPGEKVKLDIDIPAINAMCTQYLIQEENRHLETIKFNFEKAWDDISLGERILRDYIKHCQTKNEFTSEFFQVVNRQFRYLSSWFRVSGKVIFFSQRTISDFCELSRIE